MRLHQADPLDMSHQPKLATVHYRQQLRDLGYRCTRPREAVLCTLLETDRPMTASEVFDRIQQDCTRIDLATVYRNLHMLLDLGLVMQLSFAHESQFRYAWSERRGHAQYVGCVQCGEIVSLPVPSLRRLKQFIRNKTGFLVNLQSFELSGLCPDCQ